MRFSHITKLSGYFSLVINIQTEYSTLLIPLFISENQKYLYSGSADGVVCRWELPPKGSKDVLLTPKKVKLLDRFVNVICCLGGEQIVCGGSNRTVFVLNENLDIIKEKVIEDCGNISRIIRQGRMLFILSKDIFVLNSQFEVEQLFLFKAAPQDIYFMPTKPLMYVACDDGLKIVRFD